MGRRLQCRSALVHRPRGARDGHRPAEDPRRRAGTADRGRTGAGPVRAARAGRLRGRRNGRHNQLRHRGRPHRRG